MLLKEYVWLTVFWLLFGILHSVFASLWFKGKMQSLMGNYYRFYRILYSLFAPISLAGILWYHYHIKGLLLWNSSFPEMFLALIAGIIGLIILLICTKKYFFELSGIDVFFKASIKDELQTGGMNKYVRHPLYTGTLLFVWAIFLWHPFVANLISSLCISLYTIRGAVLEERKLVIHFGEAYRDYASKVPMLIPTRFFKIK